MSLKPQLDSRKATILRAIVREYVRTGQPVSSKTLAQKARLKVSAATIRNDMAVLEELGFIHQPHTSAGRIPSDLGYRWFVDNWPGTGWPDLPQEAQRAIAWAFKREYSGLDAALDSSSQILSGLTEATAVAVAPPSRKNLLRRIELISRDARRATLLMVADTGEVEQGVVEFSKEHSEPELEATSKRLNRLLSGLAFEDLTRKIKSQKSINEDDRKVAKEIDEILAQRMSNRVFRGGTANILSPDKFSDIATAHQVVGALEQPSLISSIIESARHAGSVVVLIGQEVPIEQMQACAVIFAPYQAGQDRTGSVGVIGPTRMDYPHTISAVEAVARSLSRLLERENE